MHSLLASCVVLAACAMAAGQDCNSNGIPDTLEAFRVEPVLTSQYFPVDDGPSAVALADFDGDGDLDAAVSFMADCCTYPGGTRILINEGGAGHMVPANLLNAGVGALDVVAADLDGDGNVDIATADWIPHTISVQLNSGGATFAPAIMIPVGWAGRPPRSRRRT